MVLQWFGQSFFKVETKGKVIAIDPFSREPKAGITKVPRFRADLLLVTHEHADHNNVSAVEGNPLTVRGPGEYEAFGIFIEGISSFHDKSSGKEFGPNTIYAIESEDMRIVHLGGLGQTSLTDDQVEKIGRVDILLAPVGGHFTIDGQKAAEIVNKLEPKAVIPMHFKISGLNLPLEGPEKFLKALASRPESQDKLSLKAKDLAKEKTQIFLLKPLSFASK